ncbi:MAG: hypothetical protein UZ19_OD1000719 [Parcubacteria bacterium OLB19]|nr:MAG: hypothetical protein UZ19_OD1000719 [Parcubacteria bacterium OLB19]
MEKPLEEALRNSISSFGDRSFKPFTRRVIDNQSGNPEYVITLAEN